MTSQSRSILKGLALLTITVAASMVLFEYREALANGIIPLLLPVIEVVEPRFEQIALTVEPLQSETVFQLRLTSNNPVNLYGTTFPHMDVSATTLTTHCLQHFFIFTVVITAGLLFTRAQPIGLLLLGLASLWLALTLDIPFTLLGSIEGLLLDNLAPDQLHTNLLVRWEQILTQGGRMVLALGLSTLCVTLTPQQS